MNSSNKVTEQIFRFGEGGRGVGMVTLPQHSEQAPVWVCLNAGLVARSGPYRLNTLLCRRAAQQGYIAIRVDLSGKGDTPARAANSNRESVSADWQVIEQAVAARWGRRPIVVGGICSAADNALKLAGESESIRGLFLYDPPVLFDRGYHWRTWLNHLSQPRKLAAKVVGRLRRTKPGSHQAPMAQSLRDAPAAWEIRQNMGLIAKRDGRVLTVFSGHVSSQYNQVGQWKKALGIATNDAFCEEYFWPTAGHLYPVESDRMRLLALTELWAQDLLSHLALAESTHTSWKEAA